MKKLLRGVSIALALVMLLGVTAFAYPAPTTAGIYNVSDAGWKVLKAADDPATATGITATEVTIDGTDVTDFYAEGAKVTFTLSGLTPGSQQLVMGLNKETTSPQQGDIEYVDQQPVGDDGKVTFTVFPKASTGTIHVYISTAAGLSKIGAFKLYQAYTLGDVNGDGAINSTDALWVLQYTAHSPIRSTLTPTQFLAADVNKDGSVNSTDALWILQYTAHSPLRPSL